MESNNHEMKQNINKFASQISHSSQQISGTVTILMPEKPDTYEDHEVAIKDRDLMEKYENYMESWTSTIRNTLAAEIAKKPEPNSALKEIDYWRARSATLSTLHQQLNTPYINRVKTVRL